MGGRLVNGTWYAEGYEPDADGRFVRQSSAFRDWTRDTAEARFRPEPGRYHLFVSLACPWAHRTLIMRRLRGLEDALPVSVVHPDMLDDGWEFREFPGSTADPILGARYMREIYQAADPDFTGRVTVPVLWDRREQTIVNNESRDILRMLNHEWRAVSRQPEPDFAPEALLPEIESTLDAIYEPINNGVYKCGFAQSQAAYEEAADALFAALAYWDGVLATRRFLCGDRLTEADICLYTTLVRFDAVYAVHFKCSQNRIVDYPNLWNYLRDLYQRPEFGGTTDLDQIRRHYYVSHPFINPTQHIARMPEIDFSATHDRHRLPESA